MDLRQVVFHDYRNVIFITLAAVTSAFAVRPDATILPLIGTLSVLLVYGPFLFRADRSRIWNVALTWIALSFGSQFSRMHASLDALSTPGGSLAVLYTSSGILSALTLSAVYLSTRDVFSTSSSQITLFPAIWATTWCTISHLNPVGHLATWSPAATDDAYKWVVPILGSPGKDWIIGAWAVVSSQAIGNWYIGSTEHDLGTPQTKRPRDNTKILALFLTFLTIPSFLLPSLPLPVSYSTVDVSTPITVGCALPSYTRYKNHVLTLADFITESKTIQNRVNIILWPEGAVTFHSAQEREHAFNEVRLNITGSYVGVSFEETVSDPTDPTGRRSLSQTGLAIISQHSEKPHLVYFKRNLVPIAESYRLMNSALPPTIFEVPLPKPKWISREEWGPGNRPIPITSSICLDFAQASPFAELDSRPALILAPARTWDPTVGYAMWLQAKQRAEEQGAMILWCDGGEGGVSGLAGGGFSDVAQVGSGSFVRSVGIQYPFDERRTFYVRFGDSVLLLFWVPILFLHHISFGPLLGSIKRRVHPAHVFVYQGVHRVVQYIQGGQRQAVTAEPEVASQPIGNLVDL